MARTLEAVKKTHGPRDHEAEMRAALKGIKPGEYETTMELCKRAGISNRVVPTLQPKFRDYAVSYRHKGNTQGWYWARTPADAKKLRDALKSQNG